MNKYPTLSALLNEIWLVMTYIIPKILKHVGIFILVGCGVVCWYLFIRVIGDKAIKPLMKKLNYGRTRKRNQTATEE